MITVHAQCGCWSAGVRGGRWIGRTCALRLVATRGGVERRVLDVVAHAADVVLAHRLDVQQRAAVVEVELAVPAVVHGVAEVHELRRRADVELQALEDRDDVDALVASAPSASAWCRAGWTPAHSSIAICSHLLAAPMR